MLVLLQGMPLPDALHGNSEKFIHPSILYILPGHMLWTMFQREVVFASIFVHILRLNLLVKIPKNT